MKGIREEKRTVYVCSDGWECQDEGAAMIYETTLQLDRRLSFHCLVSNKQPILRDIADNANAVVEALWPIVSLEVKRELTEAGR